MSDDRYTIPGPGRSFYVLSLAGACTNCDAPPGFTIELIEPGNSLYREYKRGDFNTEPLKFEKWADSKGIAVITGMRKHEFVGATKGHLIGVNSKDFGERGRIDRIGAETILEEMYDDSQTKPAVVKAAKAV
jgi:hypothetical protein